MNDFVHIAISPDKNYFKHGLVMLKSLMHNNSEKKFFLHVLDGGIPIISKIRLYFFCKKNNLSYRIYKVDYSAIPRAPISHHITMAAYSRIFMASIIPSYIPKILYLDCDLLVLQNIDGLINVDLAGNFVAAVKETYSQKDYKRLGISSELPYFNSGVLYINLVEWRKQKIEQTLIEFINTSQEQIFYHDQDVMNYCFQNKWIHLDFHWNVTHFFFYPEKFTPEYFGLSSKKYNEVKNNIKILHFTGSGKPWKSECKHPLKKEYLTYKNL